VITTLKKLEEDTARDVRDDFYEHGFDNPRETWLGCLKFARAYDLVSRESKPTNAAAKRILIFCRKEFLRGQSNAKKISTRTRG
jgi:hypothetical protein